MQTEGRLVMPGPRRKGVTGGADGNRVSLGGDNVVKLNKINGFTTL